jgi:type I restriction enzyme, S subunit
VAESKRTTIGDLGELFDGPHATPTRRSEGPYFLNIASLKSGRLDLVESDHVSEEDFKRWTRRVVPHSGDLLFSYETRLGEAALMPEGIQACLGRRMALLRPDRAVVEPRFLLYLYLSPAFQETIARHTIHGATVPRIGLATMPNWNVDLPPLSEQRAIAEVLGALDDKIAVNVRMRQLSSVLAHAVFNRAAVHGPRTTIRKITQLVTRGVAPKYTEPDGIVVLNQKCIRDQRIGLAPARHTTPSSAPLDRLLQRHDVLVNSTGQGTLGRAARWMHDIRATTDSHITIVRFDPALVDPVCAGFGVLQIEKQIEGLAEGSTGQTELRRDLLSGLKIAIPARATQASVGAELASLEKLTIVLDRESHELAQTRDELLPLLISGKIRVRDAEKVVEEVV